MTGRKCRGIRVLEKEGYGRYQPKTGSKIEQVLCRYLFPKYPLDKTEILSAIVVNKYISSKELLHEISARMMNKGRMQTIY